MLGTTFTAPPSAGGGGISPGDAEFGMTLQTGNFGPTAGQAPMSPSQVSAALAARAYANGASNAQLGSSSGGRYMGRAFTPQAQGIAPAPQPAPTNYNPAARDQALRALAAPATAPAPAAKPSGSGRAAGQPRRETY